MAKNDRPKNPPEKKITPVNSGLSVAIWLNSVDTDEGLRQFRTITISPKRFRDRQTGEWKDGAYSPADLGILILALEKAREYCFVTALPGEREAPAAEAPSAEAPAPQPGQGEVPF